MQTESISYKGRRGVPVETLLWAKVDKSGECWVWTGGRDKDGYGLFTSRRAGWSSRAHCVSWQLHHGPIPAGMEVCHRCDNPPCCNPAHLFLGTTLDNVRDATEKGRRWRGPLGPARPETIKRGEDHSQAKLTWEDVQAIRAAYSPARGVVRDLAARFGVSKAAISLIAHGKTWTKPSG